MNHRKNGQKSNQTKANILAFSRVNPIKLEQLACPFCPVVLYHREVKVNLGKVEVHRRCLRQVLEEAGVIGRGSPLPGRGNLSWLLQQKVMEFARLQMSDQVEKKATAILKIHEVVFGREIPLHLLKQQLMQNHPVSSSNLEQFSLFFEIFPKFSNVSRTPPMPG